MSLETLIRGLSREEKLAALDLLWGALSAESGGFVSPPWHESVLKERMANPEPGASLGLAASKDEVLETLNARRTPN